MKHDAERITYQIDEACRAIGIGRSKLYELARAKPPRLKIIKIGGRSLVTADSLRALVAEAVAA